MSKKTMKWVVVYYGEELPYFCNQVPYDTRADAEFRHPDKTRVQGIYPILMDSDRA